MLNSSVLFPSWQTEPAASCWNAWWSATAPLEKLVCWWAMPTTPFQRNMCPPSLIIMQVNVPKYYCDITDVNQHFNVYIRSIKHSVNAFYKTLKWLALCCACISVMETTCGLGMQLVHSSIPVARFTTLSPDKKNICDSSFTWSEMNKSILSTSFDWSEMRPIWIPLSADRK